MLAKYPGGTIWCLPLSSEGDAAPCVSGACADTAVPDSEQRVPSAEPKSSFPAAAAAPGRLPS